MYSGSENDNLDMGDLNIGKTFISTKSKSPIRKNGRKAPQKLGMPLIRGG